MGTPPVEDMVSARAFASAWQERAARLETERLRDLRALSETEAARRFGSLLQSRVAEPPKATSGLIEQQRILSRLRPQPR